MDNLESIAEKAVTDTVLTTSHVTISVECVQLVVRMDTLIFIATIVTDLNYYCKAVCIFDDLMS